MQTPRPVCTIGGGPWWDFHYEYDFNGSTWGFQVRARSAEEAQERMKKIALARFCGQGDGGPIPLWSGGFLVPLIVWWRNRRRG